MDQRIVPNYLQFQSKCTGAFMGCTQGASFTFMAFFWKFFCKIFFLSLQNVVGCWIKIGTDLRTSGGMSKKHGGKVFVTGMIHQSPLTFRCYV